jgi:exonuclease VII small subunit
MNIRNIAIIAFALFIPFTAQAQKKKKTVVKKPPVVVVEEEPQEDPRIIEMREATQQIIFIDSVVVGKNEFLSGVRLNPESGRLTTYDQFFRSEGHSDGYVFVNQMGNKCYFSDENDSGRMQLFTSDKLGNEWSDPAPVKGINDGISEANYPFMMTDGTTFYFAAKGQESIGGYDIFVTRYDSEDGQFLKPENIGMPFNSEANDYMYVIDEQSNIGYFVTDRRQPNDKVCVYIFIPPTSRRTYPLDNYSDDQLRSFAEISCIANTWGNGKERKQALERLKTINTESATQNGSSEMCFIINDKVTYTSVSQFRNPDSLPLYKELTDTQKRLEETKMNLEKSRNYFSKGNADDKRVLRSVILDAEQQLMKLTADVKTLEKRIRNAENTIISKQ